MNSGDPFGAVFRSSDCTSCWDGHHPLSIQLGLQIIVLCSKIEISSIQGLGVSFRQHRMGSSVPGSSGFSQFSILGERRDSARDISVAAEWQPSNLRMQQCTVYAPPAPIVVTVASDSRTAHYSMHPQHCNQIGQYRQMGDIYTWSASAAGPGARIALPTYHPRSTLPLVLYLMHAVGFQPLN